MKAIRIISFCLIMIIMLIFSNVIFYREYEYDRERESSTDILVADRIYDGISSEIEKPVIVARMMAGDAFLANFVANEKRYAKGEAIDKMQDYLRQVNDTVNFDSVFFISDVTKRYYTEKGINKTLDPDRDSHDIWYNAFKENGKEYTVEVDADENNDNRMTVFVNVRVCDNVGNVIGVCGVGMSIAKMQELLVQYQDYYKLAINIADESGLVQVDVNDSNIKAMYCNTESFIKSGDCIYTKQGKNGFTITRYIEDANWFIVAEKKNEGVSLKEFDPGFLIVSILFCVIITFSGIFILGVNRGGYGYTKGTDEEVDELTNVPNRNYFKSTYGERGVFNTTIYKSLAVFDIDYFKEANDNIDGDATLVKVVDLARECFGEKGEIFRWGGDEFVLFLEWSIEFGHEMCKEFCKMVEDDGAVTISVGITEVRPADSIKKNYHRATQGCYLVKEMGGNGVKRM